MISIQPGRDRVAYFDLSHSDSLITLFMYGRITLTRRDDPAKWPLAAWLVLSRERPLVC